MIKNHQPTIFDSAVKVFFSSLEDGSIAKGGGEPATPGNLANRKRLLSENGFPVDNATVLYVTYADDRTYQQVDMVTSDNRGKDIQTDALYTTEPDTPLLLPVADCIATVVHDPKTDMLGLLHLGRHASVAGLIEKFAEEVNKKLKSDPINWRLWMSPSIQRASHQQKYFEWEDTEEWSRFVVKLNGDVLVDLPAHNKAHFINLGVLPKNIQISDIDTYLDERYFSHRAATVGGKPEKQGRMMAVAMMTAPGEPAT